MKRILATTFTLISLLCLPAYSKTLDELSMGARYLCEETQAYYFTSSEVYLFVNMAQNHIANCVADEALLETLEYSTVAVQLNQYLQTIPTNYLRIQNVFLNGYVCKKKDVKDIWSISPNNKSGESVSNTNPFYVLHDNGILVYPLQTAAGTVEVYYVKRPTDLTGVADECEFAPQLENTVILQTAIYMLKKDHEDGKAAQVQSQLEREIAILNARYGVTIKP